MYDHYLPRLKSSFSIIDLGSGLRTEYTRFPVARVYDVLFSNCLSLVFHKNIFEKFVTTVSTAAKKL